MAKKKRVFNYNYEILYQIYEKDIAGKKADTKGLHKVRLHVIKWNNAKPTLEKRTYVYNEDEGKWFPSKAKGLTLEDYQLAVEHKEQIEKHLGEEDG